MSRLARSTGVNNKRQTLSFGEVENIYLLLDGEKRPSLEESEARTLCSTIGAQSLALFQRLEIGLRLVKSHVSLATTSWLPTRLDRDSTIVLLLKPHSRTPSRPLGPYFCRDRYPVSNTEGHRWDVKPSLLFLAITRLELYHGKRLDQSPIWKRAIIDGAGLNDSTKRCAAWLWAGQSRVIFEADFGEKSGSRFYEAVCKCIRFDFLNAKVPGDIKLAKRCIRKSSCHCKSVCRRICGMAYLR